jgi:hypothetical protein
LGYKSGYVISCLRQIKDKLTKRCRKRVFQAQLDVRTPARHALHVLPKLYDLATCMLVPRLFVTGPMGWRHSVA